MEQLQTVLEMYYSPTMGTTQADSYSVFPIPSYNAGGYFVPAPLATTTAIAYNNEEFIISTGPFPFPTIPVSSIAQSQTEEISQMLDNITFSSPPTSQVTDDNQQPITSIGVTKDTVSE